MLSEECRRRRRRNQSEIEELVLEFRRSGLTQKEFAWQVGVHPLTVARWIRTTSAAAVPDHVPGGGPTPALPSQFVKVRVRTNQPPVENAAVAGWPEVVAPSGWRLRIPPGSRTEWVGQLLAQLPRC